MRIFLGGTEVASRSKSGEISLAPNIGVALGNQPTGAGNQGLDGELDDVRIYSRALTASEIAVIVAERSQYALWKGANGVPADASAQSDDDNDGLNLFMEYAFYTSPTNFTPKPFSVALSADRSQVEFGFPRVRSELGYLVVRSPVPGVWTTEGVTQASGSTEGEGTASASSKSSPLMKLRVFYK